MREPDLFAIWLLATALLLLWVIVEKGPSDD